MLKSCLSFGRNERASVAVFFALALSVILIVMGVALDYSRSTQARQLAQDHADVAALAAARVMTDDAFESLTFAARKQKAREAAIKLLEDTYGPHVKMEPTYLVEFIGDKTVKVSITGQEKPILSQLFGVKTLDYQADAGVAIGEKQRPNIDVVMISDATGSMMNTLLAIQNNMKSFRTDLSTELTNRNIDVGDLRVKFVFYRDYMIDNHQDWTGPDMTPTSDLSMSGAMYDSPFFKLPEEALAVDAYVDSFQAHGGGSARESGLEALWYALKDPDWSNGSTNVRAVILWTDAPVREFGDYVEASLQPGYNLYWEDLFPTTMGDSFTSLTYSQRTDIMKSDYHPSDAPKSMSELKSIYDRFHRQNVNGVDGLTSMTINILDDCLAISPCVGWSEISNWDGVAYNYGNEMKDVDEIYQDIIQQIGKTAEEQAKVKSLALKF